MKKKKKLSGIILFVAAFLITLGVSYQIFNNREVYRIAKVNKLKVVFDDEDYLKITNLKSMSDQEGLKLYPYHFSITNLGKDKVLYRIKLIDEKLAKEISRKDFKYNFDSKDLVNKTSLLSKIRNNVLYEGSIKAGEKYSQDFYLRIWIDGNVKKDVSKFSYQGKIKIEAIASNGIGF